MSEEKMNSDDVESLIEELSDEELADCSGGTGYVTDIYKGAGVYQQGYTTVVSTSKNSTVYNTYWDPNGSTRTVSDRNLKENCSPVDVQLVLAQVAKLPIQTWNYKQQNPEVRHIGPMAQDFAAAFDMGESDRYIELVDANGVALAAIQALYQMLQEKDAQIGLLRTQLTQLNNLLL